MFWELAENSVGIGERVRLGRSGAVIGTLGWLVGGGGDRDRTG